MTPLEKQTKVEMRVGAANSRRIAKEKRQKLRNEKAAAKQAGLTLEEYRDKKWYDWLAKQPPSDAPAQPEIDPEVKLPWQVRKAARIADSYYDPEGADAKMRRLQLALDVATQMLDGLW